MIQRASSERPKHGIGAVSLRCALIGATVCGYITLSNSRAAADELLDYPDTTLSGRETARVENIDRGRCRQICSERTGCAGFDHDLTLSACRMYSQVASAREAPGSFAATRNQIAGFRPPSNLRPPPLPQPSTSRWMHNGSVMAMHQTPKVDGTSEIEIVYEVPKNQLLKVGIRAGSTLFRGTLAAGALSGRSRLTSSRCGIIEYDVQGPFGPRSSVPLYLRGPAPKRGGNCAIESWDSTGDNANLRFDPQ